MIRLYRGLLFLYPAEFRQEYAHEMALLFADRYREERQAHGILGVLALWLQATTGILIAAPKEHFYMILQDVRYGMRMLRKDASRGYFQNSSQEPHGYRSNLC